MSTVSGGGYLGGFLGRLFTRQKVTTRGEGEPSAADTVETTLSCPDSEPNQWLRENGRYLSPNGAGDAILAGAIYARNLVSLHVVLATFMLALFLLLNLAHLGLAKMAARIGLSLPPALASVLAGPPSEGSWLWWGPWLAVPVALLAVVAVPLGLAYWFTQRQTSRSIGAAQAAVAFAGLATGIWTLTEISERGSVAIVLTMIVSGLLVLAPFFVTLAYPRPEHVPLRKLPTFVATGLLGLIGVAALLVAWLSARGTTPIDTGHVWLLPYLVFAVAAALLAWAVARPAHIGKADPVPKTRNRLSAALKWTLVLVGASAGVAFLDSLGQTIYATAAANGFVKTLTHRMVLPPMMALIALVASAKKLTLLLGKFMPGGRLKVRWELVASGVAALLLLAYLSVLSAIAQGFLWNWTTPRGDPASRLALSASTRAVVPPQAGFKTVTTWSGRPAVFIATNESPNQFAVARSRAAASPFLDHGRAARALANPEGEKSLRACALALLVAAMITGLFGRTFSFVDLSSHHALYSARLTRAYLGASNPDRLDGGNGASVTEVIPCDDLKLIDYNPESTGGPLHLLNVTVNETVSGRSNIERRDRKGMPMALGPAGISVGIGHHALWTEAPAASSTLEQMRDLLSCSAKRWADSARSFFRLASTASGEVTIAPPAAASNVPATRSGIGLRPTVTAIPNGGFNVLGDPEQPEHGVEDLTLGSWLAISGAAFTTGLGSRTSLGLSLLLGLTNVRIGRWWDSGVSPHQRQSRRTDHADPPLHTDGCRASDTGDASAPWRTLAWRRLFGAVLPVHECLLDEFLARFHGPHRRHWYLSDGGHFENTGCYELIRRRVPIIVCCDCGADPTYQFGDIANLVRIARTDFGAEIEFADARRGDSEKQHDTVLETNAAKASAFLRRIGPLTLLRRIKSSNEDTPRYAQQHCALATVTYEDGHDRKPYVGTLILFLKATLTGDEPEDVLQYASTHEAFPQESTADQFFAEAQWESYRKLGEHTARTVFGDSRVTFRDLWNRLAEAQQETQ